MSYYIYILRCQGDRLYIGYTTDFARRYQEHRQGTAKCKFTRAFKVIEPAACWQLDGSLSEALALEHELKQLSKTAKNQLISRPQQLIKRKADLNLSYFRWQVA